LRTRRTVNIISSNKIRTYVRKNDEKHTEEFKENSRFRKRMICAIAALSSGGAAILNYLKKVECGR